MRLSIVVLMALFLLSPAFAAVNISSCGAGSAITSSDTYYLNASISGAPNAASFGRSGCIVISSDNVIIDCQGYSISHNDSANTAAIILNSTASPMQNVTIRNCRMLDYAYGIVVEGPGSGYTYATLSNDTITSNVYGIYIPNLFGEAIVIDSTVANNTGAGYRVDDYFGGTINLQQSRFRGNGNDVYYTSGASGFMLSVQDVIFGNADGTYGANTTVSHSSSSRSWGMMGWVPAPAAPSANHVSFMNKSVNITPDYIDLNGDKLFTVTMKWTNAEGISAIQESAIQLWLTNDSGNHLLNSSPDVSNNEISASIYLDDSVNSSVFSLYKNNGCPIITSPGAYVLDRELSGAPNGGSNGRDACVLIDSDDVVFDCAGHNITHDDSGNNAGIMVNGTTSNRNNITIKNCNIRDYDAGILVDSTSSDRQEVNLTNNTLISNNYGISVPLGYAYVYMQENLVANSTTDGFLDSSYFGDIINMSRDRFYGNGNDLDYPSGGSSLTISLADVILGNDAATQFANITLNHFTPDASRGIIDWVPSPSSPASGLVTFKNKSFNITHTYVASFANQFDIRSQWHPSEASALQALSMQMWLFNESGSFLLNNSPDVSNGRLSVSAYPLNGVSNSTVIALFYNSSCPVLSSSGTYILDSSLSGSPNPVTLGGSPFNACVVINSSNVDLDCGGYEISTGGSGTTVGIAISNANNVTVRNCPNVTAYDNGLRVYNSNNSRIANSTIYANTDYGIYLDVSNGNNISNVTVSNNPGTADGFFIWNSNNTLVYNTTTRSIGYYGLDVFNSDYLRLINVSALGPSGSGAKLVNSRYALVANSTFMGTTGLEMSGSNYSNITESVFMANLRGINDGGSTNLKIFNNTFRNSNTGVNLSGSDHSSISNNTAYNNSAEGFFLNTVDYANLSNNRAYNNSGNGIYLYFSTNINSNNDVAYYNAIGFQSTQSSHNNNLTNPTVYNNTIGIAVSTNSTNTTITNATIFNNTQDGLLIALYSDNAKATNAHFYNNARDFRATNGASGSGMPINLTNAIFDCPLGNYTNYTNLTILDTVNPSFGYSINWTSNKSAIHPDYFSFRQKFVEISNLTAGVTIDSLIWQWTDAEAVAPYNESKFEVVKNSSGTWTSVGATLDTGANTLTASGLNPASVYGLLQNNASLNCPNITSPGVYVQTINYLGAPNVVNPPSAVYACVKINSSNVVFDCNGYNITGNASSNYGVILVSSLTNVTVKNCPGISGYGTGIHVNSSNDSIIQNNTVFNNSYGIELQTSSRNNVTNNTARDNARGFYLRSSTFNRLTDNVGYNNSEAGFYFIFLATNGNLVSNNTAYGNIYGFNLGEGPNNNTLQDNLAYNNTHGFNFVNLAFNNTLRNNTARFNTDGFRAVLNSSENRFLNNSAYGNLQNGFYSNNSSNAMANNTAYNNQRGYQHYLGSGNLTNNSAFNNTHGLYIYDANLTINAHTSYNNGYDLLFNSTMAQPSLLNMTGGIFLNPLGTYLNYTNLSINDSASSGQSYFVNWSLQPLTMPDTFRVPFAGKFVNITSLSGSPVIDSLAWSWLDSEATAPYNESKFELWKYNSSGWTLLNQTPNTVTNALSNYSLSQFSILGILNATDNCPIISTPGTTYVQSANFIGSPNNASPLSNFTCVKIAASNVIYDCNGFNITGNSSAGQTIGIEINGSYNNVTIRNCPRIANYTYAVYSLSATNVLVTNNTAVNDSYGFYMNAGSSINVTGNHVVNMTQAGFNVIDGSAPRVFADNTADNVAEGYRTGSAPDVIFRNNSAYNATGFGFIIIANNNNLTGNRVSLSPYAYDISSSSGAILVNNAANSSGVCFALYASNTASFITNTATNCSSVAFDIFNSNRSSFTGNNATSPGSYAFQLNNVNLTNLTGNRAVGYSVYGISTVGSNLNRFVGNYVTGSTQGVHLDSSSNGNLIDTNNVVSNAVHGITVLSSQQNNITNNNASSSSNYGIYLVAAANNRIAGNNVTSNNQGIRLESSSDSNLVDLNTVRSNTNFGILVLNSQQNNVTRNNASLNNYGIYVSASNNRVTGNNASANTQTGIYVTGSGSSYNLVADNFASGNTNYGIHVSSGGNNYNNLTNNTANQNGYGIRVEASQYCILRNNRAGNNTGYGYHIGTASHNTLADNNTAGDNGDYGFYLITSDNCNLTNNLAFGNDDGLDAESSSSLDISSNVFNDNDGFGMRLWSVTGSTVNNNAAFDNPLSGIVLRESSGITATGNHAHDNGEAGMYLRLSDSNSILQNNASSNGLGGIYLNESDGNTFTDNLAEYNFMVDMGLENSTLNAISRCNVSNSLYGFIFLDSPSNNLTDSIADTFTDMGDGGGDPFLTTGGRAVYIANSSNGNFLANNQLSQASMIVVDVDASDSNLLRNNTLQGALMCAALRNGTAASVLEFNRVGGCILGLFMNASSSTAMSQNNFTGNLLGVGMFASNQSIMSMNRIGDNNLGLIHMDSEGTLMADDHFYNNSGGDLLVNMSITVPNAAINLSSVVFDSPGGIFENYTALSIDDTLGIEEYAVSWTNNASSLPLPANTFSFVQKFVTINDTNGNATIDTLTWHWLQSELGAEYDETQFGVWEYSGAWTNPGALLNSGANTLTLTNVNAFSDFAILESIPTEDEDTPSEQTEEDYDVRIIPACQGFIVEVKDGGSPVSNAFVKIMDQTTDTEMAPRYTNLSGQVFVSDCDIDVSVKASKSGRSGTESGMAECGFCPECATDGDCSLSESCIDQLCIPIDCPDGMVVDHACERFECVKDSDCKSNQSCISHHCKTVYECDYGLANTTEDDNADCDDNEYCDVPVGQPGGSCKPITGCGEIKGHSITQWECGDAAGCPDCAQGELCISHECVQNDLTCPASGIVGDNKTCQAKEDGQPCINCDYEVTLPDGKKLTGKTDQAGNLGLPLKLAGTYKVTLIKDGQAVKVISVKALPKSLPSDDEPPATGGADLLMAGLFLIILAAFAFGVFLYWRRRKGQSQKKYGKK